MNKIYKVIWSKVRNCYVAVSEIAKRNGKSSGVVGGVVVGNGAVNCGASENYGAASVCCGCCGLRMAAVTLGVAALVGGVGFGTPAAWAAVYITSGEYTVSDDQSDTTYYLNGSNITFTVTETGKIKTITANYSSFNDNVEGNHIQFAGEATGVVNGGRTGGTGTVSNNTVTISGGTVNSEVYGGQSSYGKAGSDEEGKGNKVIINGNAELKNKVYGGYSGGNGEVNNNIVTIDANGTVNNTTDTNGYAIRGGSSHEGSATGNEVNIQGKVLATKRYQILGAEIHDGTADASNNSVTFEAGSSAESGDTLQVYGAKVVSGTAKNNTVTFKAGSSVSVNQLLVYGGYANGGKTEDNTVTVNGATITGKATNTGLGRLQIIGGYSNGEAANTNNTVNLLGTGKIETTGEFTVSGSNETSGTGNELHIGGVKGSEETSSANIWTNTGHSVYQSIVEINGINNISNFDKIVLHDVAWNTDSKKPVLYGGTISNVNTLDITKMNIYDGAALKTTFTPGEKMYLLRSGNGFTGLNLSYDASTQTTPVALTSGVTYTTKDLVGGNANKFYKNRKTVALANENKDVTFSLSHISYTDQTDPANKAVTLYIQPSASDAEAGYTVDGSNFYLADDFKSLTIAGGTWNTLKELYAGYSETGDVTGKTFSVTGGTISNTTPDNESEIYGGYSKSGAVTNNTVTISKTDTTVTNINGMVYGGYSSSGIAKKNIVEISGGTITKTVYGGYSQSGTAGGEGTDTDPYKNGNKVSISGGTVNYWVYGGCSDSGAARYNTIEISGGTITNMVYGGRGATDTTGNKVTIKGGKFDPGEHSKIQIYGGFTDLKDGITSVAATGNAVTIEGGDFKNTAIYGGYTQGHNASGNAVTISTINNGALGEVYGGYVDNNSGTAGDSAAGNVVTINGGVVELVYGGLTQIGTAGGVSTSDDPYENGNKVTITGGEVGTVFGGSSNNGTASNNQVSISGGTAGTVDGGWSNKGTASNNEITITGGKVNVWLRGGFSSQGTASKNVVTISDSAEVSGYVYGGYSGDSGAVTGNTVTISKTDTTSPTIYGQVYGGYSAGSGTAGGEGTDTDPYQNGNKVNISGGTIKEGYVFGGFSESGAAMYNTVAISDGTSINISEVTGGRVRSGDGAAKGNKVTVTNSTVTAYVTGGGAASGNAGGTGENEGNKITIINSTINGEVSGGVVASGTGSAEGNIVTIQNGSTVNGDVYGGLVVGGKSAVGNIITIQDGSTATGNVYGGRVVGGTGSAVKGNTLNLSGASTNTVGGEVKNFETINFENVTWGTPALKLTGDGISQNADDSYANFNTQSVVFTGAPAVGTTTLLTSTNALPTALKVFTGATTKATITTAGVVVKKDADPTESEANGVTLAYRNTHTVALAEDSKSITYNKANLVGTVTPGSIGWVKGGTARTLTAGDGFTFNGTTAVNAADLTFTGTIHENPLNQSMTLLAGATGITGDHITQAGEGKGEIAVAYTDAKGIALNARAKGEVSVASGSVKYTINRVALDKATLGSLAWGDTDSLPESWQASGTTQIDDTNFAYTGTASTALKAGNTATILTAPGLLATSPVTVGTVEGKTVDVNYTDDAGVSYTATASGHVAAAKGAVNYVVDSVAATGVNLQSWNGKDASTAITTNGWTGTGVAVATGSFAAPTDLNLGETRTITAAPTGFFGTVTGSNAYPSNGGTLSEDTGGVKLAGSMIGGVKAEDDGTTATLTYYAMKKTADTMTLGTFAFVDGDANARTYGKEYDLTNAEITTDGLAFTEESKKAMETGKKMTLVDASGAYKNGGAALKALSSGAKTSFAVAFTDTIEEKGITFAGTHTDTLALADDSATNTKQSKLIYTVGDKNVSTATLSGGIAWSDGVTHYTNKNYKFDGNTKVNVGVNFTATANPLNTSMTLIGSDSAEHAVKGTISGTPGFTVTMNNTTLDATVTGAASIESGNLKYTVTGVTLNKVTVDGVGSDAVPEGWSTATDVQVDTDSMTVPSDAAYGQPQSIMTSDKPVFDDNNITGSNKFGANPAAFADTDSKETPAVTVAGTQNAGVKASADKKSLVYEVGKKEASAITLGAVTWAAGAELMDGSKEEYDYSSVKSVDAGSFVVKFDAPENVDASKGESMTLLKANDTLADMAEQEKKQEYKIDPVTGVHIDAMITGKLAAKGGAVTFTAAENKAGSLNFGKVEWTGDTPLIDHSKTLKNVSFNGATVDTSNIDFYKEMYIEADQTTTLVSDFGGTPGEIKGTKYMVGTAFEGEGSASMEGGNLIFRTKTSAGVSEQTHKAVMGVEATMGLLAGATGHMDKVMDGLGNTANAGPDGTSTSASVGGGKDRYETGSHVNVNSWSAAVGVGARKEMKKGTLQYGIFGEYGKGSYTMHSDVGRSDGDAHYAGGGLMAKWTNKHDVYTEASFRLGRVSDSANDLLRDGAGNAYGYDIHATYYGAHVGLGKIFNYKGGKSLDVYGKFFYTKRDGCEFDAKQHYDLDSVASSVLRIGARYGTNDKKWNWYGGLAYEYEFDGEAKGTVNGTEIRAASVKGSSVRGEFGMRMSATKDNPWQTDISIYGYGGKHRGFGGSVNVAYVF